MFAVGTREAKQQVVRDSAPVAADAAPATFGTARAASPPSHRAVHALGRTDAELSVAADAATVTITGEPLAAGVAAGRLLAALARRGPRRPPRAGSAGRRAARRTAVVHVVLP